MATNDSSQGSEEMMTSDIFTINGNKCFILIPGLPFKAKENIKRKFLQVIPILQEVQVDKCDFILVHCFIVSRAGTDIDGAVKELNALSESKPAVFMVLHHTFDRDKIVPDSSALIKRTKTLTVDCLFHEDEGVLNCDKNVEALRKIHQILPQEVQQTWNFSDIVHMFTSNWSKGFACLTPRKWLEESSNKTQLTIVLMGSGNSENTKVQQMILGKKEMEIEMDIPSVTQKIVEDYGTVDGRHVTVIQSPNFFNWGISPENIKENIQFYIRLSSRERYAFLLIISANQLIDEKVRSMVMSLANVSVDRVMVLLTVTDENNKQIIQTHDEFQKLKEICGNRLHVLNISQTENRAQVSEMLNDVEEMVKEEAFEMV